MIDSKLCSVCKCAFNLLILLPVYASVSGINSVVEFSRELYQVEGENGTRFKVLVHSLYLECKWTRVFGSCDKSKPFRQTEKYTNNSICMNYCASR